MKKKIEKNNEKIKKKIKITFGSLRERVMLPIITIILDNKFSFCLYLSTDFLSLKASSAVALDFDWEGLMLPPTLTPKYFSKNFPRTFSNIL